MTEEMLITQIYSIDNIGTLNDPEKFLDNPMVFIYQTAMLLYLTKNLAFQYESPSTC